MLATALLFLQLQAVALPVDSGWALTGTDTRIESHRGLRSIAIDNGRATRHDVRLEDGTIEFDVELTDARSFVYLQFRMESETEYEEIYFRPHKSELPDAVQYNPVWRDDSFWQLWHGPGATAAPRFRSGEWMHVRLVLHGARAALFLAADTAPALVIPLARAPRAGYIALRAFTPAVAELRGRRAARFANVVVRPRDVSYAFPAAVAAAAPEAGAILHWQISPAFPATKAAITTLASDLLVGRERWPSYPVEATGVVAIGRHLQRPRPDGAAIARLVIRSTGERLQRLQLGYSDYVTVFVNGRALFSGDAHYSFDRPRQEGLITRTQATLWLPLRDGENEILLVVVDGFGGWGLTGRLEPTDGGVLVPTAGISHNSRSPTEPPPLISR